MTTVGFIGSGQIGSTIARLAIEAGHQVVLSNSRGPETLADLLPRPWPVSPSSVARPAYVRGQFRVRPWPARPPEPAPTDA
jgi:hypothetical protein